MKNTQVKIMFVLFVVVCALAIICLFGCQSGYKVRYNAEEGGTIQGETVQRLKSGEETSAVTAVPNTGYYFVQWSDNKTEDTRIDVVEDSNISITAIFKKYTYTVNYLVDGNGTIEGVTEQTVNYGENGETVEAKPDKGYKFVEWSDGVTTAFRTDSNIKSNIDVTAKFEKITLNVHYEAGDGGRILGKVDQTVSYNESSERVEAIANNGYEFVMWSDGITTSLRTDNNVKISFSVTAIFKKLVYFKVNYNSDENGTIEGEKEQYIVYGNSGTTVIAKANEGYEFVEWSDGVTTAERTDNNLKTNIDVTAIFRRLTYMIEYGTDYNGRIKGMSLQAVLSFEDGQTVEAIPNEGYKFAKWSDGVTTAVRTDYNVKSDILVKAIFEKLSYEVNYAAAENGRIDGEISQTILYFEHSEAVEAIPEEGYKFVEWSDGVTTAVRKDYYIKTNIEVTAIFEKLTFTVRYSADKYGTIGGETEQTIVYGENGTTVIAIPNEGYEFVGWSDGVTTAERTDTDITANLYVRANFDYKTYVLSYETDGNGIVQYAYLQLLHYGQDAVKVTAIPNRLYEFVKWSDGVTTAERTDLNVTRDIYVTAIFEKALCSVTYKSYSGNTTGGYFLTESGEKSLGVMEQLVEIGGNSEKVTAFPNLSNYRVAGWSDGYEFAERQEINVTEDLYIEVYFGIETIYDVYKNSGGKIIGKLRQITAFEGDTEPVTAVADEGYVFTGWSDLSMTLQRSETGATVSRTLVAYFEPIEITFTYNYGDLYRTPTKNSVTINRYKLTETEFIIPQMQDYTFYGWYADKEYKSMLANENGILMLGYYTFSLETDEIYARWKKNDEEEKQVIYKVLTVCVDSVRATVESSKTNKTDGTTTSEMIDVDYKMTGRERELISLMPANACKYLNEWFEGEVIFEFDTYYTTIPITHIPYGTWTGINISRKDYDLRADDIPEVAFLLDSYRSIITIFGMNDFEHKLHVGAGIASFKYGCVYIEDLTWIYNQDSFYKLLIQNDEFTIKGLVETYMHEFTHTIELKFNSSEMYEYHKVGITGHNWDLILDNTRLYLLGKIEVDGKLVGIPKSYWTEGGSFMF